MISMEYDAACQLMEMEVEQGGGACGVDALKEPCIGTTDESTQNNQTHAGLLPTELPAVFDEQKSLRCDLLW